MWTIIASVLLLAVVGFLLCKWLGIGDNENMVYFMQMKEKWDKQQDRKVKK